LTENQNNLLGIGYMMAGIFLLSVMDAVAKWLVEDQLDPLQLIAFCFIRFVNKEKQ